MGGHLGDMGPLVVLWLVHTAIGAARQMYDTRVFTTIYTRIATSAAERQHELGSTPSQVAARLHMGREVVEFCEVEVPNVITVGTTFVGALAMLFWYDWLFGAWATGIVLPAWIANRRFWRRATELNRLLNDEMEQEVEILSPRQPLQTADHYTTLARLKVRLSDTEAHTWALVELLFVALTVAVLLRATIGLGMPAGAIFASVTYVFDFTNSLRQLPTVLHKLTRLMDIRRRLAGRGRGRNVAGAGSAVRIAPSTQASTSGIPSNPGRRRIVRVDLARGRAPVAAAEEVARRGSASRPSGCTPLPTGAQKRSTSARAMRAVAAAARGGARPAGSRSRSGATRRA